MKIIKQLTKGNNVALVERPEKMVFVGRYNIRKLILGLSALLERTEFYDDPHSSIDLFTLDASEGSPIVALYVTPTPDDDDEDPEPQGVAITPLYNETYPPSEVYHGGK